MDEVVEIITGRERRRRWSVEEKLRVVMETQEPGARDRAMHQAVATLNQERSPMHARQSHPCLNLPTAA